MLITGFVLGAIALAAGAAMVAFWDDIKNWLNRVAADAVERAFGYQARNHMQKAVVVVDRLVGKLRNTSTVYTKKEATQTYFDKTTIVSELEEEHVDDEVIRKIADNNNRVTEIMQYKH